MNKDILIIFPLIILFSLSMFSMAGLNTGELATGYIVPELEYPYYYDYTGRPLMYAENATTINESATVFKYLSDNWRDDGIYVMYDNQTWNPFPKTVYYMYYTPSGNSTNNEPILWDDFDARRTNSATQGLLSITGDFGTSLGLIAIVISLCIAVAIIGIRIAGSGESETAQKVIIISSAFIALWSIFSILSLNLLVLIPYGFGAILYFGLTLSYVIGIVMRYS